jgi:hypothetical protein
LQGLYLHRTTQHRKTTTHIHALSGIRTHDPSVRGVKTKALYRAATKIGFNIIRVVKSKRIGWVGNIACTITIKKANKILVLKPKEATLET